MKLMNLTPHPLTFVRETKTDLNLPPVGGPVRVSTTKVEIGEVCGVKLYSTEFGSVEGLPASEPGTIFIVSRLVVAACPEREDLFAPDTLVRDNEGRVTGAVGLSR